MYDKEVNDTVLWDKESDNHVKRTIENYGSLYGTSDKRELANSIFEIVSKYTGFGSSDNLVLLDIGCSYGQLMYFLKQNFKEACLIGIDPGKASIEIASENLSDHKTKFYSAFSHKLPLEDNSVDIIILAMVLQWIPRKYIIQTFAEIDRVLKEGGDSSNGRILS